ncbi:hypothetical protein NUW54_g3909 [Trametes sanguinea]|uniref:Uncharacterized protein n=1 Tax=Trametes sanguinea TaxID=158606 RepID=A0ACC1Q1B3_9APHY|nr:hypothetical protein NUW54_g3909 [Trametes sanguinea]
MANANDTIGAILVGALVSAVLSGTVTTQAFIYFRLYGGDDYRRNTFMVTTLWGLDALHSSMAFTSTWIYLIRHWGDATVYDYIPWTIALTVALTAIITLISHCFFAHRVYVLSGFSWWLTAPILVLACGRLVSALVSTYEMYDDSSIPSTCWFRYSLYRRMALQSYEAFVDRVGWVFTTGLSLSTAVDVLITLSLTILLQKSRTGFSTLTDHLIDVVTLYTIETGLVTSITTAVSLICWLVMPRNLIFLALHFSISKLYATSTLATLNARKSLRRRTNKFDDHALPVISSLHDLESQTRRGRDHHSDFILKPETVASPARIRTTTVELKTEQGGVDGGMHYTPFMLSALWWIPRAAHRLSKLVAASRTTGRSKSSLTRDVTTVCGVTSRVSHAGSHVDAPLVRLRIRPLFRLPSLALPSTLTRLYTELVLVRDRHGRQPTSGEKTAHTAHPDHVKRRVLFRPHEPTIEQQPLLQ